MTNKLIFLAITLTLVCSAAETHRRVKLTDIKAITLKKGKFTTGRRSSPIPQLQCRGPFCNHAPDSVQCINVGTDGNDVQWKCEADLPDWLSFKYSDVSCEDYEYPSQDEQARHYILAGSCGMTYSFKGAVDGDALQGLGGGFTLALFGIILLCFCNSRAGGRYVDGPGTTAGAAAAGAAVGYAAGWANRGGWGGGYRRRRRTGQSGIWGSNRRRGGRRTATTFSGTSRR